MIIGTHVIVVEGSFAALKVDSSAMQGFLCPMYDPSSQVKKQFPQRYAVIPRADKIQWTNRPIQQLCQQ